jgi:hypothetical protein
MNAIPWVADLRELSTAELAMLVVMILVGGLATGYVIDIIARPLGFGTFINAILALAGAAGGVYLRYHVFAPAHGDDAIVTAIVAAGSAFILICVLFYAKSRVI